MAARIWTALALITGMASGCAQAAPTAVPATNEGFQTQQVIIGDGNPALTGACLSDLFTNPLYSLSLWNPWLFAIPQYTATLIGASYGFPFLTGGCGYGGYGFDGLGWGYGGDGFGHHHRLGGVAEQNAVAYRPAHAAIWRSK